MNFKKSTKLRNVLHIFLQSNSSTTLIAAPKRLTLFFLAAEIMFRRCSVLGVWVYDVYPATRPHENATRTL